MFSLEDDAARAVGVGHDTIANFKAGGAQRVSRDRDLILGADSRRASTTILYFSHACKGTPDLIMGQPRNI